MTVSIIPSPLGEGGLIKIHFDTIIFLDMVSPDEIRL